MPVVELRQYTLHPGRRDELIALFEREFVESQEAAGMTLIGQFRDLDAGDRFIWLRAFEDMAARKRALEIFYGGPVWKAHRDAANATMIDSDDVLLLRPLEGASGLPPGRRPPVGTQGSGPGIVVCGVHRLTPAGLTKRFGAVFAPALAAAGLTPVTAFVTETAENTFPALPVREGERVLVWLAATEGADAAETAVARAGSTPALTALFGVSLQMMRLQPTARSRLHG